MRLAGIIKGKERIYLLLWEGKAEALFEKFDPSEHLFHPEGMAFVYNFSDGGGTGLIAEAENMILPFFILAGKLNSRYEYRVALAEMGQHSLTAFGRIMVSKGKNPYTGIFYIFKQLPRRIGAVGYLGMHMKIYFCSVHAILSVKKRSVLNGCSALLRFLQLTAAAQIGISAFDGAVLIAVEIFLGSFRQVLLNTLAPLIGTAESHL